MGGGPREAGNYTKIALRQESLHSESQCGFNGGMYIQSWYWNYSSILARYAILALGERFRTLMLTEGVSMSPETRYTLLLTSLVPR